MPQKEFAAQLLLALGRIAFVRKDWAEAEKSYNYVAEHYADTVSAAEAIYWSGVSYYKRTSDHTQFSAVGQRLAEKYPGSIWAEKAIPFLPAAPKTKTA